MDLIAGTTASNEITEERPDADTDGDGLVGIGPDGLVRGFGAFDDFVPDVAGDLPAAIEGGGETLAGIANFFPGDIGGGRHQRAGVFGELSHVFTDRMCFFAHIFRFIFY